ncbi:MAG TPA: iron ABC transporter permease [Kofleriaceae bacterium]|jgi:iron complex transport system permease protein
MSGFVSGKSRQLTWTRLISVLLICAGLTAFVAILAPLLGVEQDRAGRHLQLLGTAALDPASMDHTILLLRIPRTLAALLVGGALAGAGCVLQALLRNPLAEPYTLGISSGASLFAVIAIRIGLEEHFGGMAVGGASLVGAFTMLVMISRMARVGRSMPPATLVLAGVTISMFCSAASSLIQTTSDFVDMNRMLRWMMGGLDSVQLGPVGYAAIPIVLGILILVGHSRVLNALAAGPDVAASLGVAVQRTEIIVFAVSSLLVGVAIAIAGPIGFIGLIVPHALRAVIGPDHRLLVPASVFGGAILLVVCDTLARTIVAPSLLPTGAVTAVLGGPFFVAILIGQKRQAALWGRG